MDIYDMKLRVPREKLKQLKQAKTIHIIKEKTLPELCQCPLAKGYQEHTGK